MFLKKVRLLRLPVNYFLKAILQSNHAYLDSANEEIHRYKFWSSL